jgi:glycosyltransferase involved in cell wall biosynthesis
MKLSKKPLGVIIHPCMRKYRIGLFNELNNVLPINLIECGFPKTGSFVQQERLNSKRELEFDCVSQSSHKIGKLSNSNLSIFTALSLKYDFVIFSGVLSLPFLLLVIPAKILGKKVYLFDELWIYPNGKKFQLLKPILKFLVNNFVNGYILASSKAIEFNDAFFNNKLKKTLALNTHTDSFDLITKKSKENKILYLGRVVKYKGLDILIKSIKNTDFTLDVVGDGDYMEECKSIAIQEGVENKVTFFGACERDSVDSIIATYKYFCLPSRRMKNQNIECESWGFTVNEAFSHGCYVIASDTVGSSFDLIEDGINGFIFKSGSVEDLNNKINSLSNLTLTPQEVQDKLKSKCCNKSNAKAICEMIYDDFSK